MMALPGKPQKWHLVTLGISKNAAVLLDPNPIFPKVCWLLILKVPLNSNICLLLQTNMAVHLDPSVLPRHCPQTSRSFSCQSKKENGNWSAQQWCQWAFREKPSLTEAATALLLSSPLITGFLSPPCLMLQNLVLKPVVAFMAPRAHKQQSAKTILLTLQQGI